MTEQAIYFAGIFDWLNMDPRGLVTSTMGAVLSLFFWNSNGLNWKRTTGIALASIFTGGYSITVLLDYVDSPALAHLLNMLSGFLASDLLSSIKTKAPTLTNAIVEWLALRGQALLGKKTREQDDTISKP